MSNVDADSLEALLELFFLLGSEEVLGVEDRGSLIGRQRLLGILLQVLQREDVLNILVEVKVANLDRVLSSVVVFELLVLLGRQLNLLRVQRRAELGRIDGALSEGIVILHEFTETSSVSHDGVLDLLEQRHNLLRAREVNVLVNVGRLGATVGLVDRVLEHERVIDEGQVLDIALLVAVDVHEGLELLLGKLALEQVAGLAELLGRNLEVVVPILILEEASGVKALSLDEGLESILEGSAEGVIVGGGINLAVEGLSSRITD